jgi:hypothetical protein
VAQRFQEERGRREIAMLFRHVVGVEANHRVSADFCLADACTRSPARDGVPEIGPSGAVVPVECRPTDSKMG